MGSADRHFSRSKAFLFCSSLHPAGSRCESQKKSAGMRATNTTAIAKISPGCGTMVPIQDIQASRIRFSATNGSGHSLVAVPVRECLPDSNRKGTGGHLVPCAGRLEAGKEVVVYRSVLEPEAVAALGASLPLLENSAFSSIAESGARVSSTKDRASSPG